MKFYDLMTVLSTGSLLACFSFLAFFIWWNSGYTKPTASLKQLQVVGELVGRALALFLGVFFGLWAFYSIMKILKLGWIYYN